MVPPPDAQIERLPELLATLPARERELAQRLFSVVASEGTIVPPPEMAPWLERVFGSVEATLRQRVVRVTNRWTFEGAAFNSLRAHRPGVSLSAGGAAPSPEVRARIARATDDDFRDPDHRTPADSFGRVRGHQVVTAANVAKADGWHSLLIFDRHDPLAIDRALVADLLRVAEAWAARVRETDPEARHLFLLWNCLWRAGASLVHGHAQVTLSHTMAHARVEGWAAAMRRYAVATGGDYFADLVAVYRALGLAATDGDAVWLASLTPAREREVDILLPAATGDPEELPLRALAAPLAGVLEAALGQLGVTAFNVAVFGPPLGLAAEWVGFPLVARFVDRGDPLSPVADVAALELFGSSVIASDPFDVARALAE
ncbi:MAG: hypothetical protein IVW57_10445 [Ktedonobacterales bacterium]|nr:hypothetical protein [Ktedonobacterales bacterium]